jgi:hypothetical protein
VKWPKPCMHIWIIKEKKKSKLTADYKLSLTISGELPGISLSSQML